MVLQGYGVTAPFEGHSEALTFEFETLSIVGATAFVVRCSGGLTGLVAAATIGPHPPAER